jgi:2-polyprenyl-3-methyl-5-hydroxy-6-metoxy-1,4-benzoquinol methylase
MDINKYSYDLIADEWASQRNKRPVDSCIVGFASLLKKGGTILDVGCGTGCPIDTFLTERGFKVTGIDISEKMIEKAKALNLKSASFAVEDIMDFQSQQKFDGIIAFDSIWHLPLVKQEKVYALLSSLLKKGGFLLFTSGKERGEIEGEMFNHRFSYSCLGCQELKKALEKSGLSIRDFILDYKEKTSGSRDLLVVAEKV